MKNKISGNKSTFTFYQLKNGLLNHLVPFKKEGWYLSIHAS